MEYQCDPATDGPDETDWAFRERLEAWAVHYGRDMDGVMVEWGFASWWPDPRMETCTHAAKAHGHDPRSAG